MDLVEMNTSTRAEPSGLELKHIHKSYGDTQALHDITFQVHTGDTVAVLGPSGCGKSTLLAIIAGLEAMDSGEIHWNGESLEPLPPHRRDFGLMFQDFVLFPHMNVFDNVAFGLRMRKLSPEDIHEKVENALTLIGLDDFRDRDVNTLSGGEQQRVALARSLVPGPKLLMLDEPLGSLDRTLRERLLQDLKHILRDLGQTAIYVTHDQEEAFAIADRVVVMDIGRIAQIGTPEEIYRQPASLFVARFMGLTNLMPGQTARRGNQIYLETPLGQWPWPEAHQGEVSVLLRPDAVSMDGQAPSRIEGKVVEKTFRGSQCQVTIAVGEFAFQFNFASSAQLPQRGATAMIAFDPQEALQVFTK
jgi:ABC-type Fe3+/spermidine/putrescine transport system ATPase subunit